MIGTTLAVLGAMSAGSHIAGAVAQHHAAGKAAKAQSESADKAAQAIRGTYATQMGLMDPYAALGRQGANTLGRLMQPGVPYTPQMQASDARAFQAAPQQYPNPMGPGAVPTGAPPPQPYMPFARSAAMAPFARRPVPQRRAGTLGRLMVAA